MSIIWSYRSLRALLMDDPAEALKCAEKALEFAKKWEETEYPVPRDFIVAYWLIGASYISMNDAKTAETPLNFAIIECRKINLVEHEAAILLELAKLAHLRENDEESLKLATEALEIAKRCSYVLQQANIEEFLCEYYLAKGYKKTAKEHLEICIDCCTHCWRYYEDKPPKDIKIKKQQDKFYYIEKPEDYWYKPRYDSAMKLLNQLNSTP